MLTRYHVMYCGLKADSKPDQQSDVPRDGTTYKWLGSAPTSKVNGTACLMHGKTVTTNDIITYHCSCPAYKQPYALLTNAKFENNSLFLHWEQQDHLRHKLAQFFARFLSI